MRSREENRERMRLMREQDPERLREAARRCSKRPYYREMKERANKKYEKAHPEALRARQTLHNAVSRKKIIKPKACSHCGKKCNPQGHHNDYSKPLEVIWLCHKCHCEEHKRWGPGSIWKRREDGHATSSPGVTGRQTAEI